MRNNFSGFRFHCAQIRNGLHYLLTCLRFRADIAIVSMGTHWFMLVPLRWLGIRVVPNLVNTLWRPNVPLTWAQRIVQSLDRLLFSRCAMAILTASCDISAQVTKLTRGKNRPIVEFMPLYRRELFRQVTNIPVQRDPFRIFFAGQIEVDKGVFDLLEIARRFDGMGRSDIVFDLCGDGSALPALRRELERSELEAKFRCHGHCDHSRMIELLGKAHVGIVPTRSDFCEGFNQVVVECLLAGRPVVTSAVCPAIRYVGDAVVEVPPNDVAAYGDALLRLRDDETFYQRKQQCCAQVQEQFYDSRNSWASALGDVLAACASRRAAVSRRIAANHP